MTKINDVEQLELCDVTKNDLRLLSSIKKRINDLSGFGEISAKFTIKNRLVVNAKYIRIEESDNIG